jgi:hypothetical protein
MDTYVTFIINRADEIQRLMSTLAIVEDLNGLEDRCSRFMAGPKSAVMDQFVFQ